MEGIVADPSQVVGTLATSVAIVAASPTVVGDAADGGVSLAVLPGGPYVAPSHTPGGRGAGGSKTPSKKATELSGEGLKDSKGEGGSFGFAKPYLQQTIHTRHDTQRKLEMHINRTAHTPDFKPGAYKAYKLSEDAAQLLADFIQRPAIRAQLKPLVGELPGKKRRVKVVTGADGLPVQKALKLRKEAAISEETGRRVKTQLSSQQMRVLEEKHLEKLQWPPAECAALLPVLNTLGGPELTSEQLSRWFDNRRRAAKRAAGDAREGGEGTQPGAVTRLAGQARFLRLPIASVEVGVEPPPWLPFASLVRVSQMGCLRRSKKVEPMEVAVDDGDWVDGDARQDAHLDRERQGELISIKELEATHKAFAAAAASFGVGGDGEARLSAVKLAASHGEARGNPLARRVLASFSTAKDGTLSQQDWVAACCVLSSRGSKANKARTAFQVYDLDEDGFVNVDDLRRTLDSMLGNALSPQQVEQIIKRLMSAFDANDDHCLTEEEFRNLLSQEDYDTRFTMDLF